MSCKGSCNGARFLTELDLGFTMDVLHRQPRYPVRLRRTSDRRLCVTVLRRLCPCSTVASLHGCKGVTYRAAPHPRVRVGAKTVEAPDEKNGAALRFKRAGLNRRPRHCVVAFASSRERKLLFAQQSQARRDDFAVVQHTGVVLDFVECGLHAECGAMGPGRAHRFHDVRHR